MLVWHDQLFVTDAKLGFGGGDTFPLLINSTGAIGICSEHVQVATKVGQGIENKVFLCREEPLLS